ncbi:MAG: DUF6382 domain-containing protein [Clostridiales bacterium]|nr:DUF6382 domain-containing protein [Clostridiales bacterium]
MEVTYRKNVNETYMIWEGDSPCEKFALHVLQENRLPGLLPLSLREINGRTDYCFEISQGKSMAKRFEKSQISYREISDILYAIDDMVHQMEDYLLDIHHLILEPEFIFYTEKDKLLFCCHPACTRDFFSQIRSLIQYFLNKMDHTEKAGVEKTYQIFEISQQEYFRLDDLLDILEDVGKDGAPEAKQSRSERGKAGNPSGERDDPEERWMMREDPGYKEEGKDRERGKIGEKEKGREKGEDEAAGEGFFWEKAGSSGTMLFRRLSQILFTGGAVVLLYDFWKMWLEKQINWYLLVGGLLLLAAGMLAGWYMHREENWEENWQESHE